MMYGEPWLTPAYLPYRFEGAWFHSLALALPNRRTSTLRRRLATGMACSVRAFGGPHCAPHKIGIRNPFLIRLVAGLLPWLRLRTVLRASCPSDARGMNRHRRLSRIGTFDGWLRSLASIELARCASGGNSSSPLVLRLRWAGLATLGRTRYGRRWVFLLETLLGCLLKPDP